MARNKYVLLDAARMEQLIADAKIMNPEHDSLYRGQTEEELAGVAPYIFTLPERSEFLSWIYANSYGRSCGVIFTTGINLEESWYHFRRFLLVKTEDGQELYFRFYDPRVLKIFLPTCDKDQILEFFGPVQHFIVEGDSKEEAIEFSQINGELKQRIIPVEQVFGEVITSKTENVDI